MHIKKLQGGGWFFSNMLDFLHCVELRMRGTLRTLANRKVLLLGARGSLKNIGEGGQMPRKIFSSP